MSFTTEFMSIKESFSLRLNLSYSGIQVEKYKPIPDHYARVGEDTFISMIDNIRFCIENESCIFEYDEDDYFLFYLPTFKYTISIFENGFHFHTEKINFSMVPKVIFHKEKILGHIKDLLNGT